MYESRHSNSVNSLICVQQVFQPLKSNFSTEVTLCPLVSFTASSLWSVCACHEHFPTLIYYKQCHIRLLCASMCRLSVRKCTESFQKLPFPRLEVMTFWKYHNLATKAAGASVWKSTVIPHSLLVPVSERYIKKKTRHTWCVQSWRFCTVMRLAGLQAVAASVGFRSERACGPTRLDMKGDWTHLPLGG